jgi:hypothetical protein
LESAITDGRNDFHASISGTTTLVPTLKLNTGILLDSAGIGVYQGQVLPGMTGTGGGLTTLARVELAHDTRDLAEAPWYGDYEALAVGLSNSVFASACTFETLEVGFDGEPISSEGFTIIVRMGHAF